MGETNEKVKTLHKTSISEGRTGICVINRKKSFSPPEEGYVWCGRYRGGASECDCHRETYTVITLVSKDRLLFNSVGYFYPFVWLLFSRKES